MREGNCFGRGGHACGFLFNFSKGRYLFNWGVGPELRRGGSLVNILQIGGGGGSNLFYTQPGRVAVFFARIKLPHVG